MIKQIIKFLLLFSLLLNTSIAQDTIDGEWSGCLSIMGTDLNITAEFTTVDDSITGSMDIPQQNVYDLPLTDINYDFPKISFVLEIPTGNVKFEGEITQDSIAGSFVQIGVKGYFYLSRSTGLEQEKTIPKPEVHDFIEEEVTFNNGDIILSGTLTLPKYPGKHPAVVMITGSGPQNRDEEIYGFKIFKLIAEHFTNNGIAVLRYDDR